MRLHLTARGSSTIPKGRSPVSDVEEGSRFAWWIPIPRDVSLSRTLLGLTLVERRLREARRWGVSHVYFVADAPGTGEGGDVSLPSLRDPRRCAPHTLLRAEEGVPGPSLPHEEVQEVPLLAVLQSRDPPSDGSGAERKGGRAPRWSVALELDPDEDWSHAVAWYRRRIVEGSTAGWISTHLNKPISLFLSTRLAETPVTPNQWSCLNLVVGLMSGWFVAQAGWASVALGGFLFQLASIFDGVDGELAKLRLESSRFGAWLDTAVDTAGLLAFLVGAFVHVARHGPLGAEAVVGLGAVTGGALVVYLCVQLHFCLTRLDAASLASWSDRFVSKLPAGDPVVRFVQSVGYVLQKDFFSFLFFLIALTGQPGVYLVLGPSGVLIGLASLLYLNLRYGRLVDELGL